MLKKLIFICFMMFFLPWQAQTQDADAFQLHLLGGTFSPGNDELQNIYGNGFSGKIALATDIGTKGRLKLGLSRLRRAGDPFYDSPDFYAGDASTLTLYDAILSVETDFLTPGYPKLYFGVGVNYASAKETLIGQPDSKGSNLGASLSISPEVRLVEHFLLIAEVGYRFLEMPFKSGRNRYQFDLSGASFMLGIGYNLSK